MAPTRIRVEDIRKLQERGERLVFLDCRNSEAWAESNVIIPNALRVDSHNIEPSLAKVPKDAKLIAYCT